MRKRSLRLTAALLQYLLAAVASAADSQTAERVSEAIESDAVDALPRTAFYETDAAIAHGEPGTLIRAQEFAGYDLPADVNATRILYRSRSELDREVVASAVEIVPTRAAPALLGQIHATTAQYLDTTQLAVATGQAHGHSRR
jgi:hypothetical protein